VPLLLALARSRIYAGGGAPKRVREICGHFGVAGNPQGEPLEPVLQELVESAGSSFARDAKTVYVPGCATIASMPEAVVSALRSLSLLGLGEVSVVSASSACCGLPLLWAGELAGFKAHASTYAAQFSKAERLVVHDAACAHALAVRYAEVGVELRPKVVHVAAYLAENVGRGAEHPKEARSFAYADTCSLARGLALVDEPRRVLEVITGKRPVEVAGPTGREVDCCGAAGLLPDTAAQTARLMAEARIAAFRESGADELLVFSPRCAAHLRAVDPSIPVADASSVIARV
jgi:Fe-S oxidoreductase